MTGISWKKNTEEGNQDINILFDKRNEEEIMLVVDLNIMVIAYLPTTLVANPTMRLVADLMKMLIFLVFLKLKMTKNIFLQGLRMFL